MATVQHRRKSRALRPARVSWGRKVAVALLVCTMAALIWFWKPLNSYAVTGAAYGAQLGCACRHIAGRPLSACRADFEEGMGLIILSEDEATRSVTARFPLLATQTAHFDAGKGCVLEPWRP
jgi:hypothetical protein